MVPAESKADQGKATKADGEGELESSINEKLSTLSADNVNYGTVCIYKVPQKHRQRNQAAYTPRLVSIGFVHHGESQLQGMEEYKLKYLNNFLRTFRVSLKHLAGHIRSQQKLVYACYEDIYCKKFNKLKLCQVLLLDGVFILQLFLKKHFLEMREKGDIIFDNPWVSSDVLHDLMLFENQLPLKFLYTLYSTFVSTNMKKWWDHETVSPPSFNELAHKYFMNVGNTAKSLLNGDFGSARHFVEFLSILHMPEERIMQEKGYLRQHIVKKLDFAQCPTATKLKSAGVKFLHVTGKPLLDVSFNKESGELVIPQLNVNDSTETFFRNLIVFEQSGYHPKHMTSYVIMLDNLINTYKDVDLLVKYKIIRNELGSSEEVAELFNSLYKEFVKDPREFYFIEECCQLNDYSRDRWHKWKSNVAKWFSMLGRDYFGSPWSIISVIAAFVLLALTIVQTVCSVLQL